MVLCKARFLLCSDADLLFDCRSVFLRVSLYLYLSLSLVLCLDPYVSTSPCSCLASSSLWGQEASAVVGQLLHSFPLTLS